MIGAFVERHEFPQYESAGIRIHEKCIAPKHDTELKKVMPWAGTHKGLQALSKLNETCVAFGVMSCMSTLRFDVFCKSS
jgi:hypothetical protein